MLSQLTVLNLIAPTKLIARARQWTRARTPRQQRRLRRGSIVAAIAAFGLVSFDYVLTGGPDWNPFGADAPSFALVSSAAAAEHAAVLPRSIAAEPAPELPEPVVIKASLATHDPSISADDLLGAPVYARTLQSTTEIAELLAALHEPQPFEIEMLMQPLAVDGEWWR